jgi:hypothetical protein
MGIIKMARAIGGNDIITKDEWQNSNEENSIKKKGVY